MGGCFGKSAAQIEQEEREEKQRKMLAQAQAQAQIEEERRQQQLTRAPTLGITAGYFEAASLEEVDSEALYAEIERREAMPPFPIKCILSGTQLERQITVRGYEAVGPSVRRELDALTVEKVSFRDTPVEEQESTRWEELGVEVDGGAAFLDG